MRKKNQIKPEALVVPTEASVILAGSTYIQKAEEADYTDDKVSNFWDSKDSKSIWADQSPNLYRSPRQAAPLLPDV